MENVIEIRNVHNEFKGFKIDDLSFDVKRGFVTGFIGANGAGKSTTIKIIMNLIKPARGEVKMFGLDYTTHEKAIKERIGFVYDENVFYDSATLLDMKKIIAPAYKQWDDTLFKRFVDQFELPLKKKMKTFSKGMKMKASLAFALSHQAELIIMDEPTSGLDPIFRRELLDLLHEQMLTGEKTVFFSSHITTDLDRLADYITFIQNGKLVFSKELYKIEEEYAIVKGANELLDRDTEKVFISVRKENTGFEALTNNQAAVEQVFGSNVMVEKASLEDIMYFTKRRLVNA